MSDNTLLGSFEHPIRCKGVEGEHEYLRRLVGPGGAPIEYRREGSVGGHAGHPYDVYLITGRGLIEPLRLHFDMYAKGPREKRSPPGLFQIADFMKPKPWERLGYMLEVWSEKIGGDLSALPDQYAYVYSKAAGLLGRGPYVYACQDFFGLPEPEWDLEAIVDCARQIVHELHGISPSRPLWVDSLETTKQLLATFHFERIDQMPPTPEETGMLVIHARHRVTREMLTIYFKVR